MAKGALTAIRFLRSCYWVADVTCKEYCSDRISYQFSKVQSSIVPPVSNSKFRPKICMLEHYSTTKGIFLMQSGIKSGSANGLSTASEVKSLVMLARIATPCSCMLLFHFFTPEFMQDIRKQDRREFPLNSIHHIYTTHAFVSSPLPKFHH